MSWKNPENSGVALPGAFAIAALVMLVPANLLPVMHVSMAGRVPYDATIFRGVVVLLEEGLWGLAAIVFSASILVPLLKLAGMARLIVGRHWRDARVARRLTRLYSALEFIGPWSMLDVFLVAFLCGAVRFGQLASVEPRSGIIAFAAVVVLTMLSTRTFDPQILWRGASRAASRGPVSTPGSPITRIEP